MLQYVCSPPNRRLRNEYCLFTVFPPNRRFRNDYCLFTVFPPNRWLRTVRKGGFFIQKSPLLCAGGFFTSTRQADVLFCRRLF
nr:MAG TPA: hypothetical protein [Caudoviricetes sp.]